MILPNRARVMGRAARRTTRKVPVRLVSITASQSASDIRASRVSFVTPAFATSTPTLPNSASTLSKAASTRAWSVMSHSTGSTPSGTSPPARWVPATRYPASRNFSAMTRPMPRVAPVTRTTGLSCTD